MAHVNLLPWRQHERLRARNRFLLILGLTALAAALVIMLVHFVFMEVRYQQQSRNQYMQQHIGLLDTQLAEIKRINAQKESIVQRMALIQSLHEDRNTAVRLVNELATRTPQGLYIVSVEKRGSMLYIDGRSASNNRVAELLRELKRSPLFDQPLLQQVVADEDSGGQFDAFSLSTRIVPAMTPPTAAEVANGN